MDSNNDEVAFYLPNFIWIYKDGSVERLARTEIIPTSALDPQTGVSSKDVLIAPKNGVSTWLFLPKIITNSSPQKLPLLVYYHGGSFCFETPFSPIYNRYVSSLVAKANVVVVSVHFRRAPEDPLPIAYNESWEVLQWVISHSKGNGLEAWLNENADLSRITMIGDSAELQSLLISHGYLHSSTASKTDSTDPTPTPEAKSHTDFSSTTNASSGRGSGWGRGGCSHGGHGHSGLTCVNLEKLASKRVLVCVAEKDGLKERGLFYHKMLGKTGWGGELELMEVEREGYVFHLFNPTSKKVVAMMMMSHLVSFLNQDRTPELLSY
ncbi:probable carboxylesterase 4, mitochondrial [Macadamia integrifolia]|uniref:probable carboxylesterase 4, mitochondrial n=1 Tax=Macadamia integrifolia TaxID=60698 RepID=UPI001C4EFE2B|nr:probable carboxylesterase 4, mitochondrial [Macadamia integrifolia]